MVWGGISFHGKTYLVAIEGNLNGNRYLIEIIQPVIMPFMATMGSNAVYQDDNARPHRARAVEAFVIQQQINTMDWPACSPDLDPIEHVWYKLGRAIRKRLTLHSTLRNLRQRLLEEWVRIPQRYIQTLINSYK